MSSQSLEQVAARPVATRISQATAVEQSRAVAEVQAAVAVAQQFPRNMSVAIAAMRQSCTQRALAERAFFRYSRGDGTVSGETVHLARELARCWTNIDYGIKELSRDDDRGESEMLAYAWDMEANTRVSNAFLVPHAKDKKTGIDRLSTLRDIYENNTNMGGRRVRECIFAVLPPWLREEAKELCSKTLREEGSGKTMAQRIADAVAAFAGVGVTVDQIEQKFDRPADRWTDHDIAQLMVIFRSIRDGYVTREEEFPQQRVTVAEITSPAPAPAAARPRKQAAPAKVSAEQLIGMRQLFDLVEMVEPDDQIRYVSDIVGHAVESVEALTEAEGTQVRVKLDAWAAQIEPPADGA